MPTLSLLVGLLALLAAAAAFALATLANRRHMAARRAARTAPAAFGTVTSEVSVAESGPHRDPYLDDQIAEVTAQLAQVTELVARVQESVAGLAARVDSLEIADREANDELRSSLAATLERATAAELLAAGTLQQAETTRDVGAALTLQVEHLTGEVESLTERLASVQADPTALRNVAVVRYDAFADLGGRLSFSLAALDDSRSGFVLTSLAGKSEVRSYVRAVGHGIGDVTLSAEEQQAIEAACQSTGSTV